MCTFIKLFCIIFALTTSLGAEETIDLGVIERVEKCAVPPKPIYLVCSNREIERVAQSALRLYGGFELVKTAAEAQFTLQLEGNGDNVNLKIASGQPAQTLFAENFSSGAFRGTLYALDGAVQKIWGTPGFFASTLVFVSNKGGKSEIYTADLLLHSIQQLTQDQSDVLMPRFSPNGQKILYTTYYKSGFPDIYLMDLSTKTRRSFANYRGTNSCATFSPNGNAVAMVLSSTGNTELYLADTTGAHPKRLTKDRGVKATPTWSPDGRHLLFTSDLGGRPQIYKMESTGGTPKRVATNISRYNAEPNWNQVKSNLFAFTVAVMKHFQIAVHDFEKNQSEIITDGPGDSIEPVWLRDGRHIIFTRRNKSQKRLYIVDTVTKHETALCDAFGETTQAHWYYPHP